MSNDRQQVSYGSAHKGIGVNGFGPPKDIYEPRKHNRPYPMRPGSMDALRLPSLDHAGKRVPYWGNSE